MTPPTPDQFAALVARLVPQVKAARREDFEAWVTRKTDPPAFARLRWTGDLVDTRAAMALCAYSAKTWKIYYNRARLAARDEITDPRLMPAPADGWQRHASWRDGQWEAGALAIWQAIRQSHVLATPRSRSDPREDYFPVVAAEMADPGGCRSKRDFHEKYPQHNADWWLETVNAAGFGTHSHTASDAVLLPIARRLLARPGVPPRAGDLTEAAAEAGYRITGQTARRILARAGGTGVPQMEPDTLDGLVRPATLARYTGVSVSAITTAMATCWYCGGQSADRWHDDGYRAARGEPVPHAFRAWLSPGWTPQHPEGRDKWGWLLDPGKVKKVAGLLTPVDTALRAEDHNKWAVKR